MALNVEFGHQSKRVKVTPGTTMFQVLETAREEFQLDTARQYQLVHRNRPIDLSIPFRLTGISNNAAIELKEVGSAEVQQVRVCVQLPDGKRVQAQFAHDSTLEAILSSFQLLPSPAQFSLGFLRREIENHAFTTTTLKDLGIVSGSAIFRVQGLSSAPETAPQPPVKSKVTFAPETSATGAPPPAPAPATPIEPSVAAPAATTLSTTTSDNVEMEEVVESKDQPVTESTMSPFEALQLLRDSYFDSVSKGPIRTLMKIVTNILSNPDNDKMRSIRLSNAAFQRTVGQFKGGLEFLAALGFEMVQETQTITLPASDSSKRTLEDALQLLYNEADDLGISVEDRPVVAPPPSADPNFDVFKSQITRMQMQPRGPSTTEVQVDALKTKQDRLVGHVKPPRNTTIALGGLRGGGRSATAASDETSVAGPSDAQLLIANFKSRRSEMEKAMNFRTQAMRELDDLKRKKVFQSTIVRVQFPDKVVLQATFHPNETVQDVVDHVKESLDSSYSGLDFYLYVSPPMQKLTAKKTLVESSLVPAALVYLSWLTTPDQPDGASVGFYLRRDMVDGACGESKDDAASLLDQVEYPKPIQLVEPPAATSTNAAAADSKHAPSASTSKPKSGKKPAWLKL